MAGFSIRSTTEHDWRQVRDLRLEMLADTPLAFGEFLADAEQLTEQQWRLRGARGTAPESTSLAAITDEGQWVGTMGGYLEQGAPVLVGVYVTPAFRGASSGVTDALLECVETWARDLSPTITLHVHTENPRARVFYAKRGYVETGATLPYRLNTAQAELVMIKRL